jgi:hypothetical protein
MNPEKIETVFFYVLEDIRDYLPDLTLVGGWMPYIYSNFLWKNFIKNTVTTADIDFGVGQTISRDYTKTIYETLTSLDYRERHPQMDRMYPIVLYKEKIPVEFVTYPNADINRIEKMVGKQIQINKIDKFEFLLKYRVPIRIQVKKKNGSYIVNCPKPSAFLHHKGATFIDRENKQKQAKDLHYMYFILRYAPEIEVILKEISEYKKAGYFKNATGNLNKYFERISSPGCLMVEQENGPDEYIKDLRQDIFERFKRLRGND